MRPTLLLVALAVSLPFLSAGCRSEDAPKLPEGVDALPQELNTRMKELLANAEKYRGLKCLHAVPSGSLKEEALRIKMKLAFSEELPPAKMLPLEAALKAFGFIPEKMDLGKYYPELLTSQVGGYYDPRRQYLVIVQREGGVLGKEMKAQLGEGLAARMEDTIMVHELTHALQDQHFDLKKFVIEDPLSDVAAARTALVEGDATLTMYNFFGQMKMEELPMAEELVTKMMRDPKQLMAMTPDMPGAKEMESAPAYFRDGMLFSYMQGFAFCLNVKKLGGQPLLDHAFTKDPPRSSEQLIHPEKWHTRRDDPIEVALPDLTATLPGWTKAAEGTLGELGIKILLAEALNDPELAADAAAGWGGDRFAIYEKEGQRTLAWVTEWDSVKDADEFFSAAKRLGENWHVHDRAERRVIVTRYKAPLNAAADLSEKLKEAKAALPANQNINLAALGIKTKKDQGGLDLTDLDKLVGKEGKLDIDKLLNDPNFSRALKELGGDKKDGSPDLGELMNNPLVKGMVKNMLSNKTPDGKLSDDGHSYSNESLGIAITLPDLAKDWKLTTAAPVPMVALTIDSPDDQAHINVAAQPMPMALPIENMGPMLEMGAGMMFKDFKKLKSGLIGEGISKGYELQYSGAQDNLVMRATQRVYMRDGKMLVISGVAPSQSWAKNEKSINAILDAFKLSAPKSSAPETPAKESLKE